VVQFFNRSCSFLSFSATRFALHDALSHKGLQGREGGRSHVLPVHYYNSAVVALRTAYRLDVVDDDDTCCSCSSLLLTKVERALESFSLSSLEGSLFHHCTTFFPPQARKCRGEPMSQRQ
jgi:hypothetical protein